MPPTLTCGLSQATQVVHSPWGASTKLWNFPFNLSLFYLSSATFSVSSPTICVVICSLRQYSLSEWSWSILFFSSSSSTIICAAYTWRSSNWACLACLLFYIDFNSIYRVFNYCVPLNLSIILMAFSRFFSSWIVVLISSSCWSSCWTLFSSSNVIHSCAVLSKSCVTFLDSFSIISTWTTTYCSLSVVTSRGVVGVKFSLRSSISFL